jgi:hypothetical protein
MNILKKFLIVISVILVVILTPVLTGIFMGIGLTFLAAVFIAVLFSDILVFITRNK